MSELILKSIRFMFRINVKREVEDQEITLLHKRDNKPFEVEKEQWIKIYFDPISCGVYRVRVVKASRKIYENSKYTGPINSDSALSLVSCALKK